MQTTCNFEKYFMKIKPIVYRFSRIYYVHLWDYQDWLQEGRIILFNVLSANTPEEKILAFFTVKFKSHILDSLRYQEAFKRKTNKPEFMTLDNGDYSNVITGSALVAETAICQEIFFNFANKLSKEEMNYLKQIIASNSLQRNAKFKNLKNKLSQELYKDY